MTLDEKIEVMQAYKKGAPIQFSDKGDNKWENLPDAEFDFLTYDYRVAPEEKRRRMTNRELTRWLAEGNGEWCSGGSISAGYSYGYADDNNPCNEYVLIRTWDETEWHKPLVEIDK